MCSHSGLLPPILELCGTAPLYSQVLGEMDECLLKTKRGGARIEQRLQQCSGWARKQSVDVSEPYKL